MIYVDNSLLKDVAACTLKATMRHIYGLVSSDTSAPLECGTAVHQAMEAWFNQDTTIEVENDEGVIEIEEFPTPIECALTLFEYSYREWSDGNLNATDKRSWETVSCILKAWFQNHPVSDFPFQVVPGGLELGFAMPLASEVTFTGRIDLLGHNTRDRSLCFVDHKTTGWLTSMYVSGYDYDTQFTGYWSALQDPKTALISEGVPQEIHDLVGQPVDHAYVNAIELKELPKSDRRCTIHGTSYAECKGHHAKAEIFEVQRNPQQFKDWRTTAKRLASRFARLKEKYEGQDQMYLTTLSQEGMFNGGCGLCDYKDWCSVGRPLDAINMAFKYQPWKPFDYAKTGVVEKEEG